MEVEEVLLKNGTRVPKAVAALTMKALYDLSDIDISLLYEFIIACTNTSYNFIDTDKILVLKRLKLVSPDTIFINSGCFC